MKYWVTLGVVLLTMIALVLVAGYAFPADESPVVPVLAALTVGVAGGGVMFVRKRLAGRNQATESR